jgi:hypothetical protein
MVGRKTAKIEQKWTAGFRKQGGATKSKHQTAFYAWKKRSTMNSSLGV